MCESVHVENEGVWHPQLRRSEVSASLGEGYCLVADSPALNKEAL